MTGPTDLSALNPIERRFLLLLAQGHTAKSIAASEGCSVGAVNERLREARRKTGYGSSREVARAVLAQESRDEQIGMAAADKLLASTGRQARSPAQRRWIMPLLAVGGVAALAYALVATTPVATPPTTGVPDDMFRSPQARVARLLDVEPRDAAWAAPTEAALRRRFAAFPALNDVRVRCGRSICEVTGGFSGAAADALMRDLQGSALAGDLGRLGLKHGLSGFETAKAAPNRARYASYWSRVSAK